jgi:hypothetical protein
MWFEIVPGTWADAKLRMRSIGWRRHSPEMR